MRDAGFREDIADRLKAALFVERHRLCLGVETKELRALTFGFSDDGVQEACT